MKKNQKQPKKSAQSSGEKKDLDKKKIFRLKKSIEDLSKKLRMKNNQLRNGTQKQKIAQKQLNKDTNIIERKEREIIKQREELLHVTRVGKLAEFVSSLAHEISQPLTAILSFSQAAQRMLKGENTPVHDVLQEIIDADKRASNVIQRLRVLLKKSEPEMEPLDINHVISATITIVATDTDVRNIDIETKFDSQLPPVFGDGVQLQQVILNLISNSFDALEGAKDPRKISVRTSRKDKKYIMVEIKDSGCGIPKKDLKRLFTHFYTNKPDGLGMGLSISRSIVEKHGGKLNAKNNPGRGASFYFTIPVYEGDI